MMTSSPRKGLNTAFSMEVQVLMLELGGEVYAPSPSSMPLPSSGENSATWPVVEEVVTQERTGGRAGGGGLDIASSTD